VAQHQLTRFDRTQTLRRDEKWTHFKLNFISKKTLELELSEHNNFYWEVNVSTAKHLSVASFVTHVWPVSGPGKLTWVSFLLTGGHSGQFLSKLTQQNSAHPSPGQSSFTLLGHSTWILKWPMLVISVTLQIFHSEFYPGLAHPLLANFARVWQHITRACLTGDLKF
jgi:hypothetical protein